jgi:hypothetical protein
MEKNTSVSTSIIDILGKIILPVVLLIIANNFSRVIKEKEIKYQYIEIATGILSQPSSVNDESLRRWAVDIINRYSEIKLNDSLKIKLVDGNINLPKPMVNEMPMEGEQRLELIREELNYKKLQPLLCDAKGYLESEGLNTNYKACELYRKVLIELSPAAKRRLDQDLLREADMDFKTGRYPQASIKYKVLFNEFYAC